MRGAAFSKPGIFPSGPAVTPLSLIQSRALSMSRARCSGLWPFFSGNSWSSFRKSPVGSVLSSSPLPLLRSQFKTESTSFMRSSGDRWETGTLPSLSKVGTSLSPLKGAIFRLRTQSRALSISCALDSGLWPFFFGSSWSSLRNSPRGSVRSSSLPLFLNQFRAESKSFSRCSGVRRDILRLSIFLKGSGMSSGSSVLTELFRIQSKAASSSRARCSGVWPAFFGSSWSSLRKSPEGSFTSSSLPLLRVQFKAES